MKDFDARWAIELTAGLTIFGAFVHASVRLQLARSKKDGSFTWVDFALLLPIAMFSGVVFWLFSSLYFDSDIVHALAASTGSFMGIAGLNKISNFFLEILTKAGK